MVFATLLQNELNSDVAHFIIHVPTYLETEKGCKVFEDGKTSNIAIQLALQQRRNAMLLFLLYWATIHHSLYILMLN